MRTHKIIFFFFFFFSVATVDATWYWNQPVNYTSGGMTSCPQDGDISWTPTWYPNDTAVTTSNSSFVPNPAYNTYSFNSNQTNAIDVSPSGTMYCLKWDWSNPAGNISYYDGWTNNLTVPHVYGTDFSLLDTWGSGVNTYTLQYSYATNTPTFLNWSAYNDVPWCVWRNAGASCTPSLTLLNGYAYKFRILAYDIAWNVWTITSSNVKKIDTVAPIPGDVTTPPFNLLAVSSYNYQINISDGGESPISGIEWYSENTNNGNINIFHSSSSSNLGFSWDISKVDNYISANWGRQYTFRLTKICDEAGNCWNGSQDYNHSVYANTTNITTKDMMTSNPLNHSTIADGTVDSITILLKDAYGNAIIPASWIGRTIDFDYDFDNGIYLNQYGQSWNSAIQMSAPSNPPSFSSINIWNNTPKSYNAQPSSDGTYVFNFRSYAPTYNEYAKTHGNSNMTINSISFSVNRTTAIAGWDNPQTVSVNGWSWIVAHFRPLYTTQLSGDINNDGFIEWVIQSSALQLLQTVWWRAASNRNIYLEFGSGARQPVASLDLYYSQSWLPTTQMVEWNQWTLSFPSYVSNFVTWMYNLKTKFTQALWIPYSGFEKIYLASLIWYTLDGYSVSYPADVINKSAYFDNATTGSWNQAGVKVVWITASQNNSELISWQFTQDISILWNIYKTSLKKDIIANVYNLIKSVTPSNGWNTITNLSNFGSNSDGKKLATNTILYFWDLNGARVDLWTLNTNKSISWVKTIVVIGGNLYIKSNMYYNDRNSDLLWIVVLKDENGNGWNLYVDPSVTNIVWTYVLDKSVISYDGSTELDGNTTQTVLANQLHIYGSVFSENTLWGSRSNPLKCPYYVSSASCTQVEAQKYDFNYIRRFMLNAQSLPISNGKVIGWGTCTDPVTKSCTWWNSAFARNILNTGTDSYAKYPVVIEYNPLISTVFPPLFSQ